MAIAVVAQAVLTATGAEDTIYTDAAPGGEKAYTGLIDLADMAATDEVTIRVRVDVGTTVPIIRSTHLIGVQTEGFEIEPVFAGDTITISIEQTVNTGTDFPYQIARLT